MVSKEILLICELRLQIRKEVLFLQTQFFIHLVNKLKILHSFGLWLWRFVKNVCTIQPTVVAFIVKHIVLSGILSIFTGRTYWTYDVFKDPSMNIETSAIWQEFCLFNSWIYFFGVVNISELVELHLRNTLVYWIHWIQNVLEGSIKFVC